MTETTAGAPAEAAAQPEQKVEQTAEQTAEQRAEQDPAPAAVSAEVDPMAALTQENAELKDKLLRALADMENLRRRTEREIADARQYGISAFARDILGVADNMRRALDAVSPEQRADPNVQGLLEGVELTERELNRVLEKNGVTRFDPKGERFDPNFQQAMFEVPDPAAAPGTVVQVIQAGYRIGERVLRPALVAVAKAPPAPAPVNDNAGAAQSEPRSTGAS